MNTDAYRILKLEQSLFHTPYMHNVSFLDQIIDVDFMEIGKSGKILNQRINSLMVHTSLTRIC